MVFVKHYAGYSEPKLQLEPAAKVPPGNYEARITFTYGGQSTTSETEVTVEAAEGSTAAK